MRIGKNYFITASYNEKKFRALLEEQLSKASNCFPCDELVEQSIAAFLECKETGIGEKSTYQMENFLKDICYADNRNYTKTLVVGNPLEAVDAFNQIMIMFKLS